MTIVAIYMGNPCDATRC